MHKIELKQAPVISHALNEIGAEVTNRLLSLNIENLIATTDTVKALKDLRAELNKELKDFEEQRKLVKNAVNSPYLEFEDIYKTEVSEKYNNAISILKDKIEVVERKVKTEKQAIIEAYFNELCLANKIDFLKFSHLGIEINLSTSEKKYKESCDLYIQKVIDDLNLISSMPYESEVLVEYKSTLNISNSITTVNNRIEKKKQEDEAIKQRNILNRKTALIEIGCKFDEFSKIYVFNDSLFISLNDVEELEKDVFTQKFQALKVEIAEVKRMQEVVKPVENYDVTYVATPPAAIEAPLSAPVAEVSEEKILASFEVIGTIAQLKALQSFLIENNITYKNI
jgi:hypothetical protein